MNRNTHIEILFSKIKVMINLENFYAYFINFLIKRKIRS